MNESKTLTKHISCNCECKFDGIKCNSNWKNNNDKVGVSAKIKKKYNVYEKNYVWNPVTCSSKNG